MCWYADVVVTLEADNYRVTEGVSIIVPVRLEGSSAMNVAVDVTTSSGSALGTLYIVSLMCPIILYVTWLHVA